MPFFILFNADVWVLRLPQALLGICSCYIFYRLLRLVFNRQCALLGFFLSAIIPWHIMLSRWGLECNIAPFFILTGFYFFIRGVKEKKYLLLSALFYGLGLYAYATAWIYISVTFAFNLLYLLLCNRNKQTLLAVSTSGMLFAIFALPIVCLILVNNNFLPEIKTPWFSIPKLIYWRQGQFGVNDFYDKISELFHILICGQDSVPHNYTPPYGIYYPISLPFIILGLYFLIKQIKNDNVLHRFSPSLCIFFGIFSGLIYASLLPPGINCLNFLWFSLLICLALGINKINIPYFNAVIMLCYMFLFVNFAHDYCSLFSKKIAYFTPDLETALKKAEQIHQQTKQPITIWDDPFSPPKVLFYNKIPVTEYINTVHWQNYPYFHTAAFTHYQFNAFPSYENISKNTIHIAPVEKASLFKDFNIIYFDNYIIATDK